MSIKFECSSCGQRLKARDGSKGRWVRCTQCRAKVAVPGDNGAGGPIPADFGAEVDQAVARQESLGRKRSEAAATRRLDPRLEEWLMEHGIWKPAGIAAMVLFGLIGLVSLAAEYYLLFQICAFLFLMGLCSFVYGMLQREQEPDAE